jgi:hypothetical protein
MSLVLDDAIPQYASVASLAVSAAPLTLSCWVKSDDDALAQCGVNLTDADSTFNYFAAIADFATANNPAKALCRDASNIFSSRDGLTINTWHHIVAVFVSTISRFVYLNGVAGAESTDLVAPAIAAIPTTAIGMMRDFTPQDPFSGKIAEVAIYNAALSGANVTSLYNAGAGTPATNVAGANLVGYYKLIDDLVDSIAAANLTGSGSPTFDAGDHPVSHGGVGDVPLTISRVN